MDGEERQRKEGSLFHGLYEGKSCMWMLLGAFVDLFTPLLIPLTLTRVSKSHKVTQRKRKQLAVASESVSAE